MEVEEGKKSKSAQEKREKEVAYTGRVSKSGMLMSVLGGFDMYQTEKCMLWFITAFVRWIYTWFKQGQENCKEEERKKKKKKNRKKEGIYIYFI